MKEFEKIVSTVLSLISNAIDDSICTTHVYALLNQSVSIVGQILLVGSIRGTGTGFPSTLAQR